MTLSSRAAVLVIAPALLLSGAAVYGQETRGLGRQSQSFGYVPQQIPQHQHSSELDQLYSTWKRPIERGPKGERIYSCCSRIDCAPVELKFRGGKWYAVGHPASPFHEVEIPENLFEDGYMDGPESPDGRSHVCLSLATKKPLCAMRGSGT